MSKRHTFNKIVSKNRFTINVNGDAVAFAMGNLQYRASDGLWRFAEHQYDVLRSGGGNATTMPARQTQTAWIDIFNYGATGYNNGQAAYLPYTIDTTSTHFYVGNTAGTSADFSYPYNQQEGTAFRNLTNNEYEYVLFNRTGERFAKATVAGVEGLILIPNDTISDLNSVNVASASYAANIISAIDWSNYENEGFIFLPAGGYRRGTSVGQIASDLLAGFYQCSTDRASSGQSERDYFIQFKCGTQNIVDMGYSAKRDGKSIRLIQDL